MESPAGGPLGGGGTFAVLGTDFVEVLALFVRTIPLYPDGHGRVVAVSDRLQGAAAALREPVEIEVADRGLIVNGNARAELPPGPQALREALLATAVARVIFQPTTPASSYVSFARALQRNARVAGHAHLSFADLWMAPIPDIEIRELVFGAEGFVEDGADDTKPTDGIEALGSSVDVDIDGTSGTPTPGSTGLGQATGIETPTGEPVPPPAAKRFRTPHAVARDLRDLVLDDTSLTASLEELERRLVGDGARRSRSGADVLEHLVRALPLEARLDSAKGLELVRRVLARMLEQVPEGPSPDSTPDLTTRFFQALERVFPKRVEKLDFESAPAAAPETKAVASPFEELLILNDAVLEGWSGAHEAAPPPVPDLDAEAGILDPSGLLLHTLIEEPEGPRRSTLRVALLAAYAGRSKFAAPPCLVAHLKEALAAAPPARDPARIEFLASLVDDARIEFPAGTSPITLDVAVTLFPLCLSTYVRGGGLVGAIARRVGREAVLAAAPRMTTAGGALTGACLDRIVAERSFDILPFLEALLVADSASRARVVRSMRALDLKPLAAVALRVVPDNRFTDRFLRELCVDGFAGADSKRLLVEAAGLLGDVAVDKDGRIDLTTRTYAVSALGSFPFLLAERPLRAVAARRLFGGPPKELRRAAAEVLQRLARADADARPVP